MLYPKDFSGATDAEKIQNAINSASTSSTDKVVQLEEAKDYYITSPIIVKKDVELSFGYGTKFVVDGNFRVLEIATGASVKNPYIAISSVIFDSEVFYLDGKYKYYNTWNRSSITNGVIVNWAETHKGIGLSLYAGGDAHEISFVNFVDIKINGMKKGIRLKADKPATGMAWVNANRFVDISLDDCVEMISLESNETIPNECSGNMFRGLQIQPSPATKKILTVCGQQNRFEGGVWDIWSIPDVPALVEFKATSSYNKVDFNGLVTPSRTLDNGAYNKIM